MWSIINNGFSALLVSYIVDHLKGKMKMALIVLMSGAIVCWIWLGLICLRVITFSLPQLYMSTILATGLTYGCGPIFYEFTVEQVYPAPESLVGGFLAMVYNTVGMIFLLLFYIPALGKS